MSLVLAWLAVLGAALGASAELSVADNTLAVGQTVELQLQLVDGRLRGVPQVPAEEGLKLQYRGQGQSTVVRNFETTRIVRYSYQLIAVQPGHWTIGPVTLQVDGEPVTAGPIVITVEEAREQDDRPVEVEAVLSDTEPFEGEVVVHRLVFRHREEVSNLRLSPSETPGFIAEPTAEADQTERTLNDNGVRTGVIEVLSPLRAVAAGPQTVSPAVVSADVPEDPDPRTGRRRVDLFGRARTKTQRLATRPIPVTVRPLPSEGRPAGFSGLVGDFEIRARPSARTVSLGDTLTLEVVVEGWGSLAGLSLPGLPDDAGFRVYDDAPELTAKVTAEGLRSRAVLRRALVPEAEGERTLPPIELVAFDPGTEAYTALATPPLSIQVLAGDPGGELASFADGDAEQGAEVGALGDDILPAPGGATVGDRSLSGVLPLAVGLPLVPALGLLGLGLLGWRERRAPDPWAELRGRLAALPPEPGARLSALEGIFREAAGLRLGMPGPAVSEDTLQPLGAEAVALFRALSAARYGGGADADLTSRVTHFVAGGGA